MNTSQGYVYILSNPAFQKGLYKIGMTTRSADQRAWEIYTGATGVPAPFQVEFTVPVSNCLEAERAVHSALRDDRYRNEREFFFVPIDHAKICIEKIAVDINMRFGASTCPPMDAEDWIVLSSTSLTDKDAERSTKNKEHFIILTNNEEDEVHANPPNTQKILDQNLGTGPVAAGLNFSSARVQWKSPTFWFLVVLILGIGGLGNFSLFVITEHPYFLLLAIIAVIVFLVNYRDP